MLRRAFVFASLCLAAAPALAEDWPSEPRDIVAKIYALSACASGKYDCPSAFDNKQVRARYYAKSLDGLIQKAYAKSKRTNEPVIDFDPVMNTQDTPEPKGLEFVVENATADKATVAAKFSSYDAKTIVRYDFVREGGAWRVFDLRGSVNEKDPWSLRKLAVGG